MADEERYNNRQIERMFDEQSKDLKEHFDGAINPLALEVRKTNGRVKFLEKMIWLAMGALAIITPIALWMFTEFRAL